MAIGKRKAAACVSALAVTGLAVQFHVSLGLTGSDRAVLWEMALEFTVLTNLGVAVIMASVAFGRSVGAAVLTPLAVAILVVGLVYHGVLSGLFRPRGALWVADQFLHTIVPGAVLVWWSMFNTGGKWRHVLFCALWPAVYSAFVMINGAVTGVYPYPFLDLPDLGFGRFMISLGVLLVLFLILGAVLVLPSRLVRSEDQ